MRADKKKKGRGENEFLPARPVWGGKRWVGFLPVRTEILAQIGFAFRSVISTNKNLNKFFTNYAKIILMNYIIAIIFAYLFGSIPTGYILAKLRGINIREVGSGNIGATNVTRALGKGMGAVTLLGDALKGLVPVLFAKSMLSKNIQNPELILSLTGLSAVLGHVYSIFLKFKGGKGVATALGVLLALMPQVAGITIGLWLIVFLLFRISSLSALTAFALMPVSGFYFFKTGTFFYLTILLPLLIFYTHRENIVRLIRGEEKGFKKQA
jgi:glycerol-3-phosphate acyltransferase PlsY